MFFDWKIKYMLFKVIEVCGLILIIVLLILVFCVCVLSGTLYLNDYAIIFLCIVSLLCSVLSLA